MAGLSDQIGHLEAWQVSPLARFRALPDLDLEKAGRVEQMDIDSEPARGNLLPTALFLLAEHIRNLTTFAVHGDNLEPLGRLGIGPEGDLTL